jgi:hypothetical protein
MFERFSSSYFLGRLYVEPNDREEAAIQRHDHRATNRQLYATGEGVERLDHPLVMKFDGRGHHFPVLADEGVPSGTLAVPHHLLDERSPGRHEVFLADSDRARELLRYAGYVVEDDAGDGVDVTNAFFDDSGG